MQNSRPSYLSMSMSSKDRMGELMQDAIAFKRDITQNLNDYMSPSWPDQGIKFAFEGNFNNSINATTQHYKEVSHQSEEEDLCKIMLEMNKKLLSMSEELRMAVDVLKKENVLLQEKLMTTSLQQQEIRKDYKGEV